VASGRKINEETTGVAGLSWDQLLGDKLQPMEIQAATDRDAITTVAGTPFTEAEREVLTAQSRFYECLTSGDQQGLEDLFVAEAPTLDAYISKIVAEGGRLDGWDFCLADANRPKQLRTGSRDAVLLSDGTALSTCLEFPDQSGLSMLATQRWSREDGLWKLVAHKTIVYMYNRSAGGLLRCDSRGCAALTKGQM